MAFILRSLLHGALAPAQQVAVALGGSMRGCGCMPIHSTQVGTEAVLLAAMPWDLIQEFYMSTVIWILVLKAL